MEFGVSHWDLRRYPAWFHLRSDHHVRGVYTHLYPWFLFVIPGDLGHREYVERSCDRYPHVRDGECPTAFSLDGPSLAYGDPLAHGGGWWYCRLVALCPLANA